MAHPGNPAGQPDTAPPRPAATAPAQDRAGASQATGEALLVVDGTALLVRCLRAARDTELSGPEGDPTGPLMMFINSLARRLRLSCPSHVVIAWDGPSSREWRQGLWPGYKANRPHQRTAPRDAAGALPQYEFCGLAGLRQIVVPGFEADDIIAAVCRRAAEEMPDADVMLCSDDADMLQLLDGQTVLLPLTGDGLTTDGDVEIAWGVSPRYLTRVRALAGDASDGIPGLPGIGPSKAARMVLQAEGKWPLPETILPDPNQRDLAVLWRSIMELNDPPRTPEDETGPDLFRLGESARWKPCEVTENVMPFLDRYGLSRISARLAKGVLW